jgi:hypothetical protein
MKILDIQKEDLDYNKISNKNLEYYNCNYSVGNMQKTPVSKHIGTI